MSDSKTEAITRIEKLGEQLRRCQRPFNDDCAAACIADLEAIQTEITAIIALLRG
jgi:hypothetical protein